jgi:predicted nucleic acid-binding protein
MIFFDTSAFYALADRRDMYHEAATDIFARLALGPDSLSTTNYVATETASLLQRRIGQEAAERFLRDVVTITDLVILDHAAHNAAVELCLSRNSRRLSLVDCASIVYMRSAGISRAFAFDADFQQFDIALLN